MKAKVKFFDWNKGFGFITTESGEEVYVSRKDILEGRVYTGLKPGDEVEFEMGDCQKGTKATQVRLQAKEKNTNKETNDDPSITVIQREPD